MNGADTEMNPRAYTEEEVSAAFLKTVAGIAHYWATVDFRKEGVDAPERRCHGTAFSILALLDGCNMGIPGFLVSPNPHPDDPEYHRENGENWFPVPEGTENVMDIASSLHERYGRAEGLQEGGTVRIDYTNHHGERSWREITPIRTLFMSSTYHDEGRKQYILIAYDHEKQALREFATKDIHDQISVPIEP